MSAFSCLLDCFSYALQIPQDILINGLGHDGSQIIYETLPEPYCRRGFNVFELMDVAWNVHNIKLVFLLRKIQCENQLSPCPITVIEDLTSKYFKWNYPLIVMTPSHAVVCRNGQIIYDPSTKPSLTYEQVLRDHIAVIL